MEFVVVGAVVVVQRVVEDRHFPIQMYGVKKPGRFKGKREKREREKRS